MPQSSREALKGRRIRIAMNWLVGGALAVPVGETDLIAPGSIPADLATQTIQLVEWFAKTSTAGAGFTFKFQDNGADIAGWTGLGGTNAGAAGTPAAYTFAAGAVRTLAPVITAVAGAPKNITITAFLDLLF